MTRIVPAVLWLFVAVWLFWLEVYARAAWGWSVETTVAFALFATFQARASALPWLLCCAGVARAVFDGGSAPAHWLLLGVPIAALFPLRRVALPGWLLQVLVAGLIAQLLPRLADLLLRFGEVAPSVGVAPGIVQSLWVMLTAPLLAFVIGRLPPLWFFREDLW